MAVRGEIISDPAESRSILNKYRNQPELIKRLMGTEPDAPEEEFTGVPARVRFVGLTPAQVFRLSCSPAETVSAARCLPEIQASLCPSR